MASPNRRVWFGKEMALQPGWLKDTHHGTDDLDHPPARDSSAGGDGAGVHPAAMQRMAPNAAFGTGATWDGAAALLDTVMRAAGLRADVHARAPASSSSTTTTEGGSRGVGGAYVVSPANVGSGAHQFVLHLRAEADENLDEAAYQLGALHLFGNLSEVVPLDFAEARRWLAPLATSGHAGAQHLVALMHDQGLGGPRDRTAAQINARFSMLGGSVFGRLAHVRRISTSVSAPRCDDSVA